MRICIYMCSLISRSIFLHVRLQTVDILQVPWTLSGELFPGDVLRCIRNYSIDSKSDDLDTALKHKDADNCHKIRSSSTRFTPGWLFFHCAECKKCVGFTMMRSSEGVGSVSRLLFNRWPQPPDVVIYDNACNLARYCMRREPSFFKNTFFFIDRFHGSSHHNCGKLFSLKYYPEFAHINTQIAEQFHKKLSKRINIHFMHQFTALWHMRSVICKLNA